MTLPPNYRATLVAACDGLRITPRELHRELSDDDRADLAAGRIRLRHLRAFARLRDRALHGDPA
ncbi:MAG: hypothetical protein V2J02_16965 [Pseudomonadales bacterium]|jgi:hypothetical protein|nr:hypothetical protein [Pseudomonadales bacterium]